MSCKRLLDINSTFATSKQALPPCRPECHNVPVTMTLTGFREAYPKGRPLVYRYYPVAVLLLPRQPCCKPDVRFRPDAAADGAMPAGQVA